MSSRHAARRILCAVVAFGACWLSSDSALGHVALDAPDGGEVLAVGSVVTIEWHILVQHDTLNWDLWYSTTGAGGPWVPIAEDLPPGDISPPAIHTYEWTVPNDPSDQVRVRVRQDNSGMDYEDVSAANLTIGTALPDCADGDEDGYGLPGNAQCPNGPEEDCDDEDPDINPGATEVCDDFVDNDCDDFTDGDDPDCSPNTVVRQVDLTFDPPNVTVAPGDTIEWWYTGGNHTVTSGSSCEGDLRFDMVLNNSNTVATFTVPLDEPNGLIPYYCTPHCEAGMVGNITVSGGRAIPAVSNLGPIALTVIMLTVLAIGVNRRAACRT